MTTVSTKDYPVSRLPEDVRQGIDPQVRAEVVLIVDEAPTFPQRRLSDFIGAGRGVYASPEEADAYVRALRDEWD
jgi:hypothetical protein